MRSPSVSAARTLTLFSVLLSFSAPLVLAADSSSGVAVSSPPVTTANSATETTNTQDTSTSQQPTSTSLATSTKETSTAPSTIPTTTSTRTTTHTTASSSDTDTDTSTSSQSTQQTSVTQTTSSETSTTSVTSPTTAPATSTTAGTTILTGVTTASPIVKGGTTLNLGTLGPTAVSTSTYGASATGTSSTSSQFLSNKGAVAGTFTGVAIAIALVGFFGYNWFRRHQRRTQRRRRRQEMEEAAVYREKDNSTAGYGTTANAGSRSRVRHDLELGSVPHEPTLPMTQTDVDAVTQPAPSDAYMDRTIHYGAIPPTSDVYGYQNAQPDYAQAQQGYGHAQQDYGQPYAPGQQYAQDQYYGRGPNAYTGNHVAEYPPAAEPQPTQQSVNHAASNSEGGDRYNINEYYGYGSRAAITQAQQAPNPANRGGAGIAF